MKKVFIKSYGCQMNVYDSGRMADLLGAEGFSTTNQPDDADLVILNTCHIREKASEKVYSELGRVREMKDQAAEQGRDMKVVVAGCVAQAEGAEIAKRAKIVDLVVGPQSYHRLPDLLRQTGKRTIVDTDFPIDDKFSILPKPRRQIMPSAFLTVQEGCDKFCAFCVVPYTRGAEVSRPVVQVLEEARALIDAGASELTLLGQNVNAYHGDGPDGTVWSLVRLLYRLSELPNLKRLRYTTSHPNDMDDDLILAHRDLVPLMPYLHLPVQAGSDRTLKAMNRKHRAADYLRIVEKLRTARPDIALSSDFIVGFPGETDQDFEETLDLIRQVGFAMHYSFKYSPRPGTPAADEEAQVPEAIKTERLAALQALLEDQRKAFNDGMIGKTVDVLIEKPGKYPGQLTGKSPYLQAVQIEAQGASVGDMVPVKIVDSISNSLFGQRVSLETQDAA